MSETQNIPTTEATTVPPTVPAVEPAAVSEVPASAAPAVVEPAVAEPAVPEAAAPAAEADAAAPVEAKAAETAEEKVVEPISEGQLVYKGPGLVKSLIPSKKEFWLSDSAVAAASLSLFTRGEKPEVANPIVAWASQTGKGLLFFNKKGEVSHEQPHSVLPLYDAVDVKKQSAHEISFKINGAVHSVKATSDAERDGWFLTIEKAVELGKAEKESITSSAGYKEELEKLSQPAAATAGGAVGSRSKSRTKKSTDAERAEDVNEDEAKKATKSRSASRGLFTRLRGNKEETEAKEEATEAEAETKAEEGAAAPVVAETTAAAPAAETEVAAPVVATETPEVETALPEVKAEEKTKASKRGSIFGKISGFGGVKSPAKEKDVKEAELSTEPAKDAAVSEAAPQIPESTVDVPEVAVPAAEEFKAVDAAETASPAAEKKNFLSGLNFIKRGRSVSPSAAVATEEAPVAAEPTEVAPVEAEAPKAAEEVTDAPADKAVEEPAAATETANKRQSVLGSLGRRASKAIRGFQAPKKETTAAAAADKEETAAETAAAEEPAKVDEEAKAVEQETTQIGDVTPEAVTVGQPQQTPVVAATA